MKLKKSKSERKSILELIACLLHFFHFIAHLLFLIAHFLLLIAHFLGKPKCIPPRLERFPAQQGIEKQLGLCWLFCKKQNREEKTNWVGHVLNI